MKYYLESDNEYPGLVFSGFTGTYVSMRVDTKLELEHIIGVDKRTAIGWINSDIEAYGMDCGGSYPVDLTVDSDNLMTCWSYF